MKIISNTRNEDYQELEIEWKFLWFKWTKKYREIYGTVFIYKEPNEYKEISFWEHRKVILFFILPLTKKDI